MARISRISIALLLLPFFVQSALAAAAGGEGLEGALRKGLGGKLGKVHLGIVVQDLETGEVLFTRNADRQLVPASNQKVITTAAALNLLGGDLLLETSLHERGRVDANGTLHGDLIVKGGGDPNISGRFFDGDITYVLRQFADAVRERGIRRVEGSLTLDANVFDGQFVHPSWPRDQLDSWYCAPIGGLGLNDGCVDIVVAPARAGHPARVTAEPDGWLTLEQDVTTRTRGRGAQNQVHIARLPGDRLRVSGWVREGAPAYRGFITVEEPVRYLGVILRRAIESVGVVFRDEEITLAPAPVDVERLRILAVARSPMSTVIQVTNTNSQNLYAECLLKLLGHEVEGEGSWAAGSRAVDRYLRRFGSVTAGFRVDDGSGLSRENRVTARGMVAVLVDMWQSPAAAIFLDSLARSGGDVGSLRKRLRGPGEQGRIAAKTGHIHDVNALSGYVLDKDGHPRLAFSMLANDFLQEKVWSGEVGKGLDALCREMIRYVDRLD